MTICFVPMICAFAYSHQRAGYRNPIDGQQADTTQNTNTDSLMTLSKSLLMEKDSLFNDTTLLIKQLSAMETLTEANHSEWQTIQGELTQWQQQYQGNDTMLIAKEKAEIGNASILYKNAISMKSALDTTTSIPNKIDFYKLIIEQQSKAMEKMKWLLLSLTNLPVQWQEPEKETIQVDSVRIATDTTLAIDTTDIEFNVAAAEIDTVSIANNQRFMDAIFTKDSLSLRALISGFDKTSLTEAWNLYRQLRFDEVAKADSTNQQSHHEGLMANQVDTTNQAINYQAANQTPQSVDQFMALFDSSEKNGATTTDKVAFVVQIAACREPLDTTYLRAIYKGDQAIETKLEDGWHKYQIGSCYEYSQAKEVLKSTKIKGAFIVAYRNNEKLTLWRVLKNRQPAIESTTDESLTFVVQIIASREPVTNQYIQKKYKGNAPWRMVEEDNWYKYQIVTGSSYGEAKNKLKLCEVKGAFIVAYQAGERIPLEQAIKKAKKQLP